MPLTSMHFCTSDAWGGLEIYASTLIVELQKMGQKVFAVCRPNSKIESYLRKNGVQIVHLPNYYTISPKSIRFIKSFLSKNSVNIIHIHFHKDVWNSSFALMGDRERKFFLSIYMGVSSKKDLPHRFIYKRINALFTSSKELNAKLPQLYPVPDSKIHYLPYGRDVGLYSVDQKKRIDIRARYGVRAEEILIGTILRIDPGKGVLDFVKSFKFLAGPHELNVRFLIVGEPTRKGRVRANKSPFEEHCEKYQDEIKRFIIDNDLESKITLAGFQDDLIGYLSAMDLFVFPSRDELYSLVVLDAMCMGLPVVAARSGGNKWQIEDNRNGLLYNIADSKDLADKLTQYLASPVLRENHGRAARLFVEENHSMQKTVLKLLDFYQNI